MKNRISKLFMMALMSAVFAFSSCQKEGFGDFSLSVKEVGPDFVELFVTAPEATEIAYILSEEPQLITPAVLFKSGKLKRVKPADKWVIDYGIFENRGYYLYAAAKDGENGYVTSTVQFKTKEYSLENMVTIVRTYYNGFMAHIKVPEATKKRGNVIRYGTTSLAWYNVLKSAKGGDLVDVNAVAANGDPFSGYVKNDSTIVIDDYNTVLLDEEGVPVLDENGMQIDIHDPIAMNEPTVFVAGECKWGTPDEYAAIMGFYKEQKRSSYSVPMFDPKTFKWTGEFQKEIFNTRTPEQSEAMVTIEIPEEEIDVTDAMVYFTMDENVDQYFYMILDDMTYNQILAIYLDGNEEWFQWFLTSYIAFWEWGIHPVNENMAVNAASSFVEPLQGGQTYHVLATIFEKGEEGDYEFVTGSKQNFVHTTFKAKEKTKPAPVINVTKVDTGDPYSVAFNIKAGKDSDGNVQPIMGAYWVCNYAREFEFMFNMDWTYATLLKNNGNVFTPAEVAEINSDKGLTLSFSTLDGETTRFAAYGCNDEYTFNLIDETKNTAAWVDYAAVLADAEDRIDSPLFEKLAGEWTISATLNVKQQQEDESVVSYDKDHKSKVVISTNAPELPALEESVFPLYPKKSRKEVQQMYDDLCELNTIFGESRALERNRLLCTGFLDFDYYNGNPYPNRMKYRSPYDLFKATDYSSLDIAQIIYDFGPKWFFEVREDGSVIVPFHSYKLPPVIAWPGYPFYLGGYAEGAGVFLDSNDETPGFPVEISDDFNTITIKPLVFSDGKNEAAYYMNICGLQPGTIDVEIVAPVKSDIVLTRGWTETSEKAAPVTKASSVKSAAKNIDGSPYVRHEEKPAMKHLTKFSGEPLPEYKNDETPNVVTMDMVNAATEKILKHFKVN